jgi:hypothetical protein
MTKQSDTTSGLEIQKTWENPQLIDAGATIAEYMGKNGLSELKLPIGFMVIDSYLLAQKDAECERRVEEVKQHSRFQALAYIMLWAVRKTPDLDRVKNTSEYNKAFWEGRWDALKDLKKLISKKADVSFLGYVFDEAMEGVGGSIEWKDGYYRGAKEVVEKMAAAMKGEYGK